MGCQSKILVGAKLLSTYTQEMVTLQEIDAYLNRYLSVENFSDMCPNGIQVEGKSEVRKVATAVSANLATIEAAIAAKADLLIVHHGLFWNRDSDALRIEGVKRKKLALLLHHNLSLLTYHLPLDAHPDVGNNWKVAKDLGWQNLQPFGLYQKSYIGVKATFPPKPIDLFIKEIEAYYGHPATVAKGGGEKVSSVALVSGGAYRELSQAAKEKVDCFITGNFDEPAWSMAHESAIHFLALGHSSTERVGPKALGGHLSQKFAIEVSFLDIPNPF